VGTNPPRLGDPAKVVMTTLGCTPEQIAARVIVTPFVPLKAFRKALEGEVTRELAPAFFFKGFCANHRGRAVTVINTGVGPSRVGDVLSILSLTGAKEVLFAGAVGGLAVDGHNSGWEIGDWFLPTEAADAEGYTRYVLEPFADIVEKAPLIGCDGGLENALEEFLRGEGIAPRTGRVFTIGSIAFESEENLRHLADTGFDALEMELSAFFAAARHHQLRAAALTYISDFPLGSSLWREKTKEENTRLRDAYRALPNLCLDFAATL
jgi:purine-nucleoside phosphorylase